MISELASNQVEGGFDPYSFAGKLALLGGTGYGLYKTARGSDIGLSRAIGGASGFKTHQEKLLRTAGLAQPLNEIPANIKFIDLGKIVQKESDIRKFADHGGAIKALTKASSTSPYGKTYLKEFENLLGAITQKGYTREQIGYSGQFIGEDLISLSLKLPGDTRFTTRPAYGGTDIFHGSGTQPTRYTGRVSINRETGEVVDISTEILRKQKEKIDEILPEFTIGRRSPTTKSPRDIEEQILKKSIFEDNYGLGEGVQPERPVKKLREFEAIIDPLGEFSLDANAQAILDLAEKGKVIPGTPKMTVSGFARLPNSPILQIPGGGLSQAAAQRVRESSFLVGGGSPKVKQPLEGMKALRFGVASNEEFQKLQDLARLNVKDRPELKQFIFGELAEEEFVLNKALADQGIITNKTYRPEIDLTKGGGNISEEFGAILDDIAVNRLGITRPELIKKMQEPGGVILDRPYSVKGGTVFGASTESVLGERTVVKALNEIDSKISQLMITESNTLKMELISEYGMGIYQKIFGTFKGTAKAVMDTPSALAHLETIRKTGRLATAEELPALRKQFSNIDLIIPEHPLSELLSEGVLPGKRVETLIESTLGQATEMGDFGQQYIQKLGFEVSDGQVTNVENLRTDELLNRFKQFKGEFGKTTEFQKLIDPKIGTISTIYGTVTPEFHRVQMGAGQTASMSQRAFYNVAAVAPELATEIASRMYNPGPAQMTEMQRYLSLMGDKSAEAVPLNKLFETGDKGGLVQQLFAGDLKLRQQRISELSKPGSKYLTVSLPQAIETSKGMTINNIVISADPTLASFVGKQPGNMEEITALDRAQLGLLEEVRAGNLDKVQYQADRVETELKNNIKTVDESMFRGKISGSTFSQAQSELPGMEAFAQRIAKEQGLKEVPEVVAWSSKDITRAAKSMGLSKKEALKQAKGGELWGIFYREPAEGIHRTQPVVIGVAEELGAQRGVSHTGVQFVSKGLRPPTKVDFDADQISTILFGSKKSVKQLKEWSGGGDTAVGLMGKKFREAGEFFDVYKLKGMSAENAFEMTYSDMLRRSVEVGKTEKGLIPFLSTELKDVHWGSRQMLVEALGGTPSPEKVLSIMNAQATVLLGAEAGLTARHRSTKALESSFDILDILKKRDSGKLAEYFDKITFMSGAKDATDAEKEAVQLGQQIRAGNYDDTVLDRIGRTIKRPSVFPIRPDLEVARDAQRKFAKVYKEMTGAENIATIFKAADYGSLLRNRGLNAEILSGKQGLIQGLTQRAETLGAEFNPLMRKGLKNIGLYGILPAAALGLAGTLLDSNDKPVPIEMSAKEHEKTNPETTSVPIENKVWAMPKKQRLNISGNVSRVPNPEQFSRYFSGSNIDMIVSDRRKHMTQDYIDRKVKRGL